MKKIFAVLFATLIATQVWAYDFQSGDLYYNIISDTEPYKVEVTYQCSENPVYIANPVNYSGLTTAVIPETVSFNGITYSVTGIGYAAFHKCESLTSASIPSSITTISTHAFSFSGLTSVNIPNSVTTIETMAFLFCSNLPTIDIPSSVTYVGSDAFRGCENITNINVDAENQYYSSDNGVLFNKNKTSLVCYPSGKNEASYSIPGTVTTIGAESFFHCNNLISVIIPNSVTTIGGYAFYECGNLSSINIPESVTKINNYTFFRCKSLESISIPSSVKNIGECAFADCSGLTSVDIPSSVEGIGENAFRGIPSITYSGDAEGSPWGAKLNTNDFEIDENGVLTGYTGPGGDVIIPDGVTSIGEGVFRNTNITSVTIPNSVTTIDNNAFYGCRNIASLTIPNSVQSIGSDAFWRVKNIVYSGSAEGSPWSALTVNGIIDEEDFVYEDEAKTILSAYSGSGSAISIPDRVTCIDDFAFYANKNITSISIPSSVTSIGMYAFADCNNLQFSDFDNALYLGNDENLYYALIQAKSDDIESCQIHNDCEVIAGGAFYYCRELSSVKIPERVKSIGYGAFFICDNLASVTIPNSVTSIGAVAFSGCSSLEPVTVPSSVTNIGYTAFAGVPTVNYADDKGFLYADFEHTQLIGYTGTSDAVEIPNDVTSIAAGAFANNSNVTSVKIPSSVTDIGYDAFYGVPSITYFGTATDSPWGAGRNTADDFVIENGVLTGYTGPGGDVEIPTGVTSIGEGAFQYCDGLTSVTIPEGVTSIGNHAFQYCDGLTSVTIPNSVTTIGDAAFMRCNNLTSVTISESVTSIGEDTFYYCVNLSSVNIPDGVTSIGNDAFCGCTNLSSLTIPNSVTSIGYDAFWLMNDIIYYGSAEGSPWGALTINGIIDGGFVYEDEAKTILSAYIGLGGDVTIPNKVTRIDDFAFYSNKNITSITIPSSVSSIGNQAVDCINLQFYEYDNALYLGNDENLYYALIQAKSDDIESCQINNNCRVIADGAFAGCDYLEVITIPSSVTTIGNDAFLFVETVYYADDNGFLYADFEHTQLTGYTGTSDAVEIPNDVTSIATGAFANNSNVKSVKIPSSVTTIGDNAFSSAQSITYSGTATGSPWGATFLIDENGKLIKYYGTDANVDIPEGVTSIGDEAFMDCYNLKSVFIPEGVTSIGQHAFFRCNNLTSVTIPEGVTSIGEWAFANSSLSSVTIPEGVTSIGENTFYDCSALTSVTIPSSVTSIGNGAFERCYGLKSVFIPSTVTSIGDQAFYDCNNIASLTIPNSVESIGAYAFYGCSNLEPVTVPSSVTSIGNQAFDEVPTVYYADDNGFLYADFEHTRLARYTGEGGDVKIPEGVTSIDDEAFYYCSNLSSVTIPKSVTSIGDYAFDGCNSLEPVTIPSSVENIGLNAFRGVETIIYSGNASGAQWGATTWKKSATDVEEFEFADDEHTHLIKYNGPGGDVEIPDGVITIGEYAFQNCTAMTSVYIPESVTTIENYAFKGCNGLQKAEFASIESLCAISYKDNPYYYGGSPLLMAGHLYIKGIEDEITEFTIPESVTTINDYVFYGSQITTLIVPEGIEVGENAFLGVKYVYPTDISHYPTHGQRINDSQLENWDRQLIDEDVKFDNCIIISKPGTISTWEYQFNPPTWYAPSKTGDEEFEITFDARYVGYGKGDITFIQGHQFPSYSSDPDDLAELCAQLEIYEELSGAWQLQMYVEQLFVEEFTDQPVDFEPGLLTRNVHFRPTREWQTFTMKGHLGRHAMDSIDLQLELGTVSGEYDIRNFKFKVGGEEFASYFTYSEPEPLEQLQANDSRLEGWKPVNATPFYDENVILRNEYSFDPWSSRFDPPTWYAPSKTGNEEFEIIFQAKYEGDGTDGDETGHITFCQGLGFSNYSNEEVYGLCEQLGIDYVNASWEIQSAVEQMTVDEFTGQPKDFKSSKLLRNVNFYPTSYWQTFSMKGHLGRHAKDSVDLSLELGKIAGDYSIRNFVLIVDGEVFADYFCSEEFLSDINNQLASAKGLQYAFSTYDNTAKVIGFNGTGTSVDIPATVEFEDVTYSVTAIDDNAFKGNSNLTAVTIAYGIETIGAQAFSGCTGLSKVDVPSSVATIGSNAFLGVPSINYSGNAEGSPWGAGRNISNDFVIENGVLTKYNGTDTDVVIPDGVTSIGDYAFYGCNSLTSVTIPEGVTNIGYNAFYNCNSLTSVTIPEGVTSIGNAAFSGCTNLSSITIPNSITSIGKSAFSSCRSLTSVTIPENVTSIGYNAFNDCTSLTSVTISEGVTSIGDEAFENCTNLTSVQIPASVKEIGNYAFGYCGIDSVTLPETVESVGTNAFLGVKNLIYSGSVDISQCGAINVIRPTVQDGDFVFANATKTELIKYNGTSSDVEIPNTVETIGVKAFNGNESITTLTIPSSVKYILEGAFANCHNLTEVLGCDNLETIGAMAFRGCHHLKNITLPNKVQNILSDAFLYVKNVEYYGTAYGKPWGALTVNGYPAGDYIYADREQTRLTAYIGNSRRAFIPDGVVYIGPMAFFESKNLSVIEIPSTVRNIGNMAFANCTNLTIANIPQSVSILGRSAFRDCPSVEIDIEFESAPYSWSAKWDYTLEEGQIHWGNVPAPQPTPVAVSESAADNLQVYAHGNTIVVENAADDIYVYDAMGALVCRDAARHVSTATGLGARAEIRINTAGIYIVKVGNVAKRVMVND